jgi:glutamate N-acetyltransferase/amino-acid N-acetyltransferase
MKFIQNPKITDPTGYTAAAVHAGFKRKRMDLCVIKSEVPAKCSAVFTKNVIKAAPVLAGMETLKKSGNLLQVIIINSGNANAGTGIQGLRDVEETVAFLASKIEVPEELILASSTGVIGELLDMNKMRAGIEAIHSRLSVNGGADCAEAILTTDTVEKAFGVEIDIDGFPVKICGITKGSGMIAPNMATTLAFMTSDVNIDYDTLKSIFTDCVNYTYNMVTIDGHMRTNDTALIMANGLAGNPEIQQNTPQAEIFKEALYELMLEMAKAIVRDGEGATKFVTIMVSNVDTFENARKMAFGIANSPLVKTALFGQDPNWGRILSAAGMVDVVFDPDRVDLLINGTTIFQKGNPLRLERSEMTQLMTPSDLKIQLLINNGSNSAVVYTSDLSYEYVKINAEYHT